MISKRRFVVSIAFVIVSVHILNTGCASAPAEAPPVVLRGTYQATNQGPIHDITFRPDLRYELHGASCDDDSCTETGTYGFGAGRKTLILTSDAGRRQELPLEVTETVGAKDSPSLQPQDIVVGSGTPLTRPSLGIAPGTAESAQLGGQGVLLNQATSCLVTAPKTIVSSDTPPPQDSQCGFYEKKPCDPSEMLHLDFNSFTDAWDGIDDCKECLGTAALAGALAYRGQVRFAAGTLGTIFSRGGDCAGCYNAIRDSPPMKALDCTIVPCQYTTASRQNECETLCHTAYAYVPRVGTACQCTDDANEACCRVKCYDPKQKPDKNCQCGGGS